MYNCQILKVTQRMNGRSKWHVVLSGRFKVAYVIVTYIPYWLWNMKTGARWQTAAFTSPDITQLDWHGSFGQPQFSEHLIGSSSPIGHLRAAVILPVSLLNKMPKHKID